MSRRRRVYDGKAKTMFEGPEPGTLIQYFKDDATAFNGEKLAILSGKGVLNNRISAYLMTKLADIGIPTAFIRRLNMREQLVREVDIVPIEVVIRNVAAGSFSRRFGVAELASDESGESLLRRADAALYQAKARGRDSIVAAREPVMPRLPELAVTQ